MKDKYYIRFIYVAPMVNSILRYETEQERDKEFEKLEKQVVRHRFLPMNNTIINLGNVLYIEKINELDTKPKVE